VTSTKPVWVFNRVALAAHRRLLAEHGGAPGVDLSQLALALGWPKTVLAFAEARVSLFELAAAYSEAILRLRPFASGNERMGWLLGKLFLTLNGLQMPAPPRDQLTMYAALGAGRIDRPRYARWLLLRRAVASGTVIGIARDRSGRVVRVGVLRPGTARGAGRSSAAPNVPMLHD
jgi:death-on-curing protein